MSFATDYLASSNALRNAQRTTQNARPCCAARVLASGAQLKVPELKAHLAGKRDGYRIKLGADELRHCDRVIATGSLALIDVLERMLART